MTSCHRNVVVVVVASFACGIELLFFFFLIVVKKKGIKCVDKEREREIPGSLTVTFFMLL
jgi:hypothetical protein